ncbi:mechanosensitive ion channel family protein [Altererythrobacter lutimaris]|uniref:Mechanosensitive ion channel n=1 Tax=Altererythrobacter lutimaris TaxID=2743979 RepID=A0A850H9S7_9SPHN|nr:mechanosensitive ion channel domain-containing protein [Altererythrobacter lutimaris]NVE94673.1 mechanosensitive ion channel [Altererythrobacter lutimaris]
MTTPVTPEASPAESETALDAEPQAPAETETAPVPEPTPEPTPTEAVQAAEGLKEAVASKSETAGSLIETLDSWAIVIGGSRISVWDGLVAISVLLLVIVGAWLITKVIGAGIKRATKLDGTQQLLVSKISTIIVWAIAFLIGIDILGIDLTALAVFSGAFGLAIGFGLQKTFGNLISGILLLLDKSIKPGDVISVTDQAGNESVGQIRKIGIRAISVITRDRTEHLIPNENLMINQVVNWSYSSRDVRVKAPVGVSYGSDLKLVEKLLYEAAGECPRVLKTPPPRVNLMGFGDSSVDFDLRFWIDDPEEGLANIRSDVYMRIWELFQQNDIEIPFPQRDLNLRGNPQIDRLIEALSGSPENSGKSNS